MPTYLLKGWEEELRYEEEDERKRRLRKWIAQYEDQGHGSCILSQPEAAQIVEDCLLFGDGKRYQLFAWVVMPNHLHALIRPKDEWPLGEIVKSWKSFSARRIHEQSGGSGVLWQREYFDRYIRNEEHFLNAVSYIERNPVKAGLVDAPEAYEWSSARLRNTPVW